MPASSLFTDLDRAAGIGDDRALQLALELSMLGFGDAMGANTEPDSPTDLTSFVNPLAGVLDGDVRSKKSQNMTECVPVPSSEHVAEIVGRQGCKIKALRAKTNTYIKTPVRGEEPVFVVTGRKEDVAKAKREILSAAEHFSQIRASRKNNLAGLGSGASTPPGPPANIPGHVTIQVRVPYRVVGLVVGPKGATIKRIQHQTHTYIVTPSRDKEPVFEVTGLPESVESARREIEAHIAMRTGNGTSINGLPNLNGLDDSELIFNSLYKNGLSSISGLTSILNYMEPNTDTTFPTMTSSIGGSSTGAFSSAGSCSSSSSTSSSGGSNNGRGGSAGDLGAIWSSSDDGLMSDGSPAFVDNGTNNGTIGSIWSYPGVASVPSRSSPANSAANSANSASPAESLLGSAKCIVCNDAKVTHALVPCGHNFFCMDCANRLCDSNDALCPVCSLPAIQAIRIYSPNP